MQRNFYGVRQAGLFDPLDAASTALLSQDRELSNLDHRDEWDNWDGHFASDQKALLVPEVDRRLRKGTFKWRDKHPFALAITHDIDIIDPYSVSEYWTMVSRRRPTIKQFARYGAGFVKNSIRRKLSERLLNRPVNWDFKTWLEVESRFGFKSTWFVFPDEPVRRSARDCAYRWSDPARWSRSETLPFRDAIHRLSDQGWEVGLHASIHAATDANLARKQRLDLERASGKPVSSVRQHYLRYDVERTASVHENAGFLVDSTLGMNRRIGFRLGTSFPMHPWDPVNHRLSRVLEVPMILEDVSLFSADNLALSLDDAKAMSLRLLDEVERVNGVFTILFHPNCQHDGAPWDLFNLLLEECHRRGAWGPTLSELREHWLSPSEASVQQGQRLDHAAQGK